MIKQIKLGKLVIKNNIFMAPMAGITDLPFRELAKEGGAGLVCTEMISAKALVYKDKKTLEILNISEQEHPVSVQIFGSEPSAMSEAAKICEGVGADVIDINMGCPAHKVVKTGAGSRLAENEKQLFGVMEAVVNSVKAPVSIKLRVGEPSSGNAAGNIIGIAEKCGVKMVVLHGRPASQMHSGEPNLEAVALAVKESKIPVIGNGGIKDELSAKLFFEITGCAGIMLGRAAIGDPGIFNRIERYMETGSLPETPPFELKIELLKRHAKMSVQYYGEKKGITVLRKVAPYYLRGLPNASKIRNEFNKTETLEDIEKLFSDIWESPYFKETVTVE